MRRCSGKDLGDRDWHESLRRNWKRARFAFERDDVQASLLDVENLFAVGRKLRETFEAGGGSQLFRHGRFTREFVERIEIEI